MKKKYTILIVIVLIILLITFISIWATKPKDPSQYFLNTIPLIGSKTLTPTITQVAPFKGEGIPNQTNYKKVADQITAEVSSIEKSKIREFLPIRIEDFNISTPITTTINVFTLETDPPQSIRIELYGPNFNNASLAGADALAFKASFLEIKKTFKQYKLNLNNLQIIYGNRQYIQDTATYWVKEFNLLN